MCVGPTDVILGRDVVLGESHCRIITASGSVVGVDGMLRFIWEDPTMEEVVADDFTLSLHLIDGAKDWLLSMPELSAGGFRAFLDRKLGKSFLVFPNGFAVLLAQETDDCWSLDVAVYQNIDGTLRFGLASGELFKMISEPVFEKVRDVDRGRPCNVDSVARDSDLSCFMDESQTDGAYFSWSGDRDDPCVSFLAGDASLRCSHDVNSWDSDPKDSLDGDDYEWLVEDDSDGTPALKSMSDHFFENVDGVDPVWYNGGQRVNNDGDAELSSNGHHICDYVDPVSSSGGQQVYDEIGSIPDDRNRLHQCKVHSTMPSGVDVWAGPQNGSAPSDIFVGSLRKANAAVEFEDVSDSPGLCKVCKQDVMSFVGIVSCACDMSDGMASKGIPQWLYEEGKIDVENTVDFHFESSMVFDDSPGNEQFGIPVCGVCQVYEVENLASHMCRVCQSAVYGAESSESQFVQVDPQSYGHLPVGGVQLFCQRCATGIVSGDYCHNCAQLLGVPFLSDAAIPEETPQGIKVSMEYADGVDWNNPLEEKIKVYNNTDYDFEVDGSGERMVIDANGVREDTSSKEGLSSGAEDVPSKEGLSPGSEDPLLKELIGALDIESNDKIEKVKEILKQLEEQKKLKGKKSGDKHLTKKARAARKAAGKEEEQEEEVSDDELTWEDKGIMKGLGIHDTQHVSSSVSVKEMISRASAKVCQVLQDIENHLRTKEGRPARAHVDHLSRSAMNAVLDPRNDECFNKSLAFKELFHVYAAKAIRVKDVIKNATTNGWCDPMKAEWKRILIDFPCLEAISELPQGKKWVPLLWVLVQKKNSMGTDTRKKARIVACQTLEKFWYEKDEKISPTVNPDAVKIMCGLCLQLDMTMETRDQAGGYLHAEYPDDEEPVYVRVPDHLDSILKDSPELVPKTPDGRVAKFFRVRRALYGCQLSCRIFYQMFRDFMVGSATVPQKDGHRGTGWTQSEIDPCVFFKKEGKGFAILCCHVDDSLIIATKDEDGQRIRQEFFDAFASRFEVSPECTDGDVHEYLSMLITIDRRAGTLTFQMPKLFIKLKALLESMGDRAKKRGKYCRKEIYVRGEPMNVSSKGLDQKKVRTPMALDNKDIYAESSEENPIVPYDVFDSRRILGLAAYIILGIRPDAAHAAAIVARFTGSKQTEAVIKHTVRLAWYLVDTEKDYVLTFRKSLDGLSLSGMVDASFANDPKTKRSYFGYVLRHGANPIAWRSKLEASVALSTRDAELMAAVHSVQHILGIRFFLSELGLLKEGATSVMTDNKASMEGVQNDKNHKGSHYMGYRLSWLREQVADLLVHFEHVESKKNVADIFTKVLCEDDFVKLRSELLNLEELVS